jgi:hypothetical protein
VRANPRTSSSIISNLSPTDPPPNHQVNKQIDRKRCANRKHLHYIVHAHRPIAEPTNKKRTNQRDHARVRSLVCQSTTSCIDGISTTNSGSAIHATPKINVRARLCSAYTLMQVQFLNHHTIKLSLINYYITLSHFRHLKSYFNIQFVFLCSQ